MTDVKYQRFDLENGLELKETSADISTKVPDTNVQDELEIRERHDRLKEFYDHCQNNYDIIEGHVDTTDIRDYGANLLKEFLRTNNSVILDIGCSIGETGQSLQRVGFTHLHGMDTSRSNLELVKNKNIYKKLECFCLDPDGRLPCGEKSYDGVISMGNFLKNQLTMENLVMELCRIIRPGGYAVFTYDDINLDPRALMTSLGQAMFEKKVELTLMEKQHFLTEEELETSCICCVVKILASYYA